jgi:hypothetical protein
MRVNKLAGLKTLIGFGPRIENAVKQKPDGLLLHEPLIYSLFPAHLGMRQYWRDFASLEAWARSEPHRQRWQNYFRSIAGTGFWHEAYFRRGGFEAIYDELPAIGKVVPATGAMFSSRKRLGVPGESAIAAPVSEDEKYQYGSL